MENIFENAYFGKPYKTRDGRKAVYLGDNTCWIEGGDTEIGYSRNGLFVDIQEHGIDIVSEWTIDEKELNKMATQEADSKWVKDKPGYSSWGYICTKNAYKAGYRKAKEE